MKPLRVKRDFALPLPHMGDARPGQPESSFDAELDALGIDVALLRAQLSWTPAERISELVRRLRFHEDIQQRTLDAETRAAIDRRLLEERIAGFGESHGK